MNSYLNHYIDGRWIKGTGDHNHVVINPATEEPVSEVVLGTTAEVEMAVDAARTAFEKFSRTSKAERVALFERIMTEYEKRTSDIARSISDEMGCPISIATGEQVGAGLRQFRGTLEALKDFTFEDSIGKSRVLFEPVGVAALITPWNWPLNQISAKVAPALAAGNAVILKPSEQTPGSAVIFAEVMEAAGVPSGVFNLVHGDGPGVGEALSTHPGIDMISFTGSTRAGILVAKNAASTVKRVHQELGGKCPDIILEGTSLDAALRGAANAILINSGQSCHAPTRILVHQSQHDEAVTRLAAIFNEQKIDDPAKEGPHIGPVVSKAQYEKIQSLIKKGIDEGATLAAGGLGLPPGKTKGYFVRPTIFGGVSNDMVIAREEIFGPVLVVIPYEDDADAIRIANDTPYGLAAYIAGDPVKAKTIVPLLRAGGVYINVNGLTVDFDAPFGGYKQSGNGHESGRFGIVDFLEVKAVIGELA